MSMTATIYTLEPIGDKEIAEKFLNILENKQLTPQKIGLYEPVKLDYTIEEAVKLWTQENEGCYIDGVGMTGKAGGMLGKIKEPRFLFDVFWWNSSSKVYINVIEFIFPVKTFKKYQENIEDAFKETIDLVNAIYGYITHNAPLDRQHVTGNLKTRMPGVFWCNYFGDKYIKFFSEEKITSFPWHKSERTNNGGIIVYLTEEPDKELINSDKLEFRAKNHLGIDSFGDVEAYKINAEEIQIKNVPKL